MKICFVCNEYPPAPRGGVGTFVYDMTRSLSRLGHAVWVIGVYPGTAGIEELATDGSRVIRLPRSAGNTRLSFIADRIRLAKAVSRLVERETIDVVETPEGGGWSAFFRLRCPVLVRLHNTAPYFARLTGSRRGLLVALAENLALRRADALVAVSQFLAEQAPVLYPLSKSRARPVQVIYNGVDTDAFHPFAYSDAEPGRIVFAGTIKPVKGVDTLLNAFNLVAKQLPGASLHLYGKDTAHGAASYFQDLLRMCCTQSSVRDRILYHGSVPFHSMTEIYRRAAVCPFPSVAEGFALVPLEAMSSGRPVIFTSSTSGPELIEHGRTGFLCDPGDHNQLAHLIVSILGDRVNAESVGVAAAQEVCKRFSVSICMEETLRLYRRVVEDRYKG